MTKLNRKLLLIGVALAAACNLAPKTGKTYTFKEVGWTMTLPPDFRLVDSVRSAEMTRKGVAMMEKSAGTHFDVDPSVARTLITARKGPQSYFNSTIVPYDTAKDGDFAATSKAVKDLLHKTFADKMPDATLDTTSESVKVDGVDFDRYRLSVTARGKAIFTLLLLSKLYKGYLFDISYLYTDVQTKAEMEGILAGSKFQ
jgi:hypothetical protein